MKTERISASLGIKFVYCDGRYVTETGVLFTKEEASTLNEYQIRELYAERLKERLYDYEYAKTTGFVRKRKELVFAPPEEIESEDEAGYLASLAEKVKGTKVAITPVRLIKAVVFAVSVGAIIMSALYSGEYQGHRVGKALGYFQAAIMVLFSTAAFEAGIIFFRRKQLTTVAVGCLFFALWLIPSFYNMYTVMNITFDSYKEVEDEQSKKVNKENASKEALGTIDKKIGDAEKDVARLRGIADAYIQRETYSVWTAQENSKSVEKAQKALDALRNERTAYITAHPDAIVAEKTERESFAKLVHRLFGIRQEVLQLVVDTFPAIFFDIVAPFGFAMVILLKEEDEDNGRKENEEAV